MLGMLFFVVWAMLGLGWLIPVLIAKLTHHPKAKSVYWSCLFFFILANPMHDQYLQINLFFWIVVMIYATIGRKLFKK